MCCGAWGAKSWVRARLTLGSNHTDNHTSNGRCSRRDVSYCPTIPVREEWGGMQQKYLQVVLEEEVKESLVGGGGAAEKG